MTHFKTLPVLLILLATLGCASTPGKQLAAGDLILTVQLVQDGKVLKPDESGVYKLKRSPFTITDTRSVANVKHFLGAHFTADRQGCESLMQKQAKGYAIGALTGSGAAWNERVVFFYDEELDTLPAEYDSLKAYFGSEDATIKTIIAETTLGNTQPGIVCFFPRYPVHYEMTPRDTKVRDRTIYGFAEEGQFPAGPADLLLTLHRYAGSVQFVRQVDVTHFRLQFETE